MKEDFRKALEIIYDYLKDSIIKWALFGSMNLLLQGLPVEPNDIDILTDKTGAYEMEKKFLEYSTRKVVYCSDGKVTSHFGALEIAGVKAEIVGDYTANKDMQLIFNLDDRVIIPFEDMQIPCMPLEKELIAYGKEEKSEKVKLIKEFLSLKNA
jgi:hypothetical protein